MKKKPNIKVLDLVMSSDWDDVEMGLGYASECGEFSRKAKKSDVTLEAMAILLDNWAGNCNAHDFCGVHKLLALLLHQELGRTKATRIMRRLVNYEGLNGMDGVAGSGDPDLAKKELGWIDDYDDIDDGKFVIPD